MVVITTGETMQIFHSRRPFEEEWTESTPSANVHGLRNSDVAYWIRLARDAGLRVTIRKGECAEYV